MPFRVILLLVIDGSENRSSNQQVVRSRLQADLMHPQAALLRRQDMGALIVHKPESLEKLPRMANR